MSAKTFEEWWDAPLNKKVYVIKDEFLQCWNASRAALLAESPEVEELVREAGSSFNPAINASSWKGMRRALFEQTIPDVRGLVSALLFLSAKVKALEEALDEQNCPRKYVQINGAGPVFCLHGTSSINAFSALEGEIAKLKGHAEAMAHFIEWQVDGMAHDRSEFYAYRRDYPKES